MAPLNRALALAEVNDVSVRVREHLDLDVPRILEVLLDVHRRIGEVRLPLALRGLEGRRGIPGLVHELEPFAAASRHRLQRDRPADLVADADRLLGARDGVDRPRNDRDARRLHGRPRKGLRPHELDRVRRRPYPDEARVLDRPRERGILGEEPVAGMNRLRAGTPRNLEQAFDDEIALARRRRAYEEGFIGDACVQSAAVGLGVDGHRSNAELAERPEDAYSDLAPVRYEHAGERGHRPYSPWEPCRLLIS